MYIDKPMSYMSEYHLDIFMIIIIGGLLTVIAFLLLFMTIIAIMNKCALWYDRRYPSPKKNKRMRSHESDSDEECGVVISTEYITPVKKPRRSDRIKKMYNHVDSY